MRNTKYEIRDKEGSVEGDEQRDNKVDALGDDNPPRINVYEGVHVGFADAEGFEDRVKLERHERHNLHDRAHVNLSQEEYTPAEVARLVGTSLDVVMHAIWHGELKAERQGKNVVCIPHEAVTAWLRERGGV